MDDVSVCFIDQRRRKGFGVDMFFTNLPFANFTVNFGDYLRQGAMANSSLTRSSYHEHSPINRIVDHRPATNCEFLKHLRTPKRSQLLLKRRSLSDNLWIDIIEFWSAALNTGNGFFQN